MQTSTELPQPISEQDAINLGMKPLTEFYKMDELDLLRRACDQLRGVNFALVTTGGRYQIWRSQSGWKD